MTTLRQKESRTLKLDTPASSKPKPARPRRSWGQRAIRALVCVALLAIAAYVTLPWYVPKDALRSYLQRQLTRHAGAQVTIGGLAVSWADGLELRDVRVASGPQGGDEPLVQVEHLQADFSPLKLLVQNRIEWVDVASPRLNIRIDADGNCNLSALNRGPQDGGGTRIARISVHDATVKLTLPNQPPLELGISDLQLLEGRVQRLSRLTVTGGLRQPPSYAPLNITIAHGGPATPMQAVLNFSQVKLQQLHLEQLLGLPVEDLSGLCSGSLQLKMNARAVVDSAQLKLTLQRLDMLTTQGRLSMQQPVLVEVAAAYDPLISRLDVQQATLRLGGLELAGSGTFGDLGNGIIPAVRDLDLVGKIDPAKLAAAIGAPVGPEDEMQFQGPLRLEVHAHRRQERLALDVLTDASGAALHQGQIVLKPSGRALRWELSGGLDERGWHFLADKSKLTIGENVFVGDFGIDRLHRVIETWSKKTPADILRQRLGHMRDLTWHGTCEIRDLPALAQLLPQASVLSDVVLDGPLTGSLDLKQVQGGTQVAAGLSAPEGTSLSAGSFRKPRGQALDVRVGATLDVDGLRAREATADVTLGQATLSIDHAGVQVEPEGLHVWGEMGASRLESLLACLPPGVGEAAGLKGDVDGRFDIRVQQEQARVELSADLTNMSIDSAMLTKPSGQRGHADLFLQHNLSAEAGLGNRAAVSAQLPFGQIRGSITFSGLAKDSQGQAQLGVDIADAASLQSSCPPLAAAFAEAGLAGSARARAGLDWKDGRVNFAMHAWGDDVAYADKLHGRSKAAGSRLRFDAEGSVQPQGALVKVDLTSARLDLGGSKCEASGSAVAAIGAGFLAPGDDAQRLKLKFDITGAADRALLELLPDVAAACKQWGISGQARLSGSLDADSQACTLDLDAQADQLAVSSAEFCKPAGTAGRLRAAAQFARDSDIMHLWNVRAALGYVKIEGIVDITAHGDGAGPGPTILAADLKAQAPDASELMTLLPSLRDHKLAGQIGMELQYKWRQGHLLQRAVLDAADFRCAVGGKDVRLAGRLEVQGLRPRLEGLPDIAAVAADSLELQIGDNHGFIVADVRDFPVKTRGSLKLLFENVDDADLAQWCSSLAPRRQAAAPAGTTRPADLRAVELLGVLRELTAQADLAVSVSADRYRTFDSKVQQTYDLRSLQLEASVKKGLVKLDYDAGLHGGTIHGSYACDLKEPSPLLTEDMDVQNVRALKNIQPQISVFFPGNIVEGNFSRQSSLTMQLRDVLAEAIDHRYPVHPTGSAKTVTTDGYVEGRAAPGFVTKVFPGLNLARYKYKTMTGFAQYNSDGSADNDMLFSGSTYDIYIEGVTLADNKAQYEIGLVLGGGPDWNHQWKQGRIPILKFKGRIEGGKMHDEEVTYPWPNETLFKIFLQNNVLYRLWLNQRR